MDRGLAVFFGCADLERQFEFVQKEWVNAPKFQGLLHDKDPIAGGRDGTYNMTIQHKPIKKTLHGLPRFTTVKVRRLRLAARAAGASLARQRLNQHASGSVSESGTLIALMRYQRGSLSRPGRTEPEPVVEGPSAPPTSSPLSEGAPHPTPTAGWWWPRPAGAVQSA